MNLSTILNSIESFITANAPWIVTNASGVVFLGCVLEQIIVPIPASLVVLSTTLLVMQGISFSLAALGTLIIKIVLPAALGITLGSLFYFLLAYKLGKPFIQKTSRFLGVTVEDVENVERQFKENRYDDVFMFLVRCFPVIPSIAINLFCGLMMYDLRKYVTITFLGSAVQVFGWGVVAWLFGNLYQTLENTMSLLGYVALISIVLLVVWFIVTKKREKIMRTKDSGNKG